MKKIIAIIILALLSGCAALMPQPDHSDAIDLPQQFSLYSESVETSPQWWLEFDNNELTGLIETAIQGNFTIREAWSRLDQARSTALKTTAQIYPNLSGSLGITASEQRSNSGESNSSLWSLGLSSSYEVDLWGRVQSANNSIDLLTRASAEDVHTAIVSVSGQIAEVWTSLISSRQQQALFEKQLAIQNELLKLLQFRLARARSTSLDIYQQQQSIEKLKSSLLQLASQQDIYKRQLALLCGRTSLDQPLQSLAFPLIKDIPAVGIPADLLAGRPDIRAAGLRLQSSQWLVAAAKADRLPALKLAAALSYSDEQLDLLFDNWLLSLAGNLAGPIFDGSKKMAEVERTRAIVEERLAQYGQKVFNGFKEVEDSLARENLYTRNLASLDEQIRLSEATLREALERYLNGNDSFLNVLKEELELLQLRQQHIIMEQNLVTARIGLYKSLGGSPLRTDSQIIH